MAVRGVAGLGDLGDRGGRGDIGHAIRHQSEAVVRQVLVEGVGRNHAQRTQIVFQSRIDVVRQGRLQIGIAARDRRAAAVGGFQNARNDVGIVRARNGAGQGETTDQLIAEAVAQRQVREEIGLVAINLDQTLGARQSHTGRRAFEVGLLDTQADQHIGRADIKPGLAVTRQNVFLGGIVGCDRLRNTTHAGGRIRVGRAGPHAVEIVRHQTRIELEAEVVVVVFRATVAEQRRQRAGVGGRRPVAEPLFVRRHVAGAVFGAELQLDFATADDRRQFEVGLEGDIVLLGRVRAEGVFAEAVVVGVQIEARRLAEGRIGRLIMVGRVVGQGRRAGAIDQLVAVRIGLFAVGERQGAVPDRSIAERLLAPQHQGGDVVLLSAVTQLLVDAGVVEGRAGVGRARLQRAVAVGEVQRVAELVVPELGVGALDPQSDGVAGPPFQRAGHGLAGPFGLVVLEQGVL